MRTAMMPMIEQDQDRQIADLLASEKSRLRRFIRRRVPNESDVEDLIQEVFFELVRAHRLLQPIDSAVGWLYGAARNRRPFRWTFPAPGWRTGPRGRRRACAGRGR